MVRMPDSPLMRLQVYLTAIQHSGNRLTQDVYRDVPVTKPVTSLRAEMHCSWEGNRRSGIALAMHHRFQWFIHLWLKA